MTTAPNWLIPDKLASFDDDAFRAELGPRRIGLQLDDDGKPISAKPITPEKAFEIEQHVAACKKAGEAPTQSTLVDMRERFAPLAWKLYRRVETGDFEIVRGEDGKGVRDETGEFELVLDDDGNPIPVTKFVRVGTADSVEAAQAFIGTLAGGA